MSPKRSLVILYLGLVQMVKIGDTSQTIAFSEQLLSRVNRLSGQDWFRNSCFLYSAINREKVRGLRTNQTSLCVILQGTKEIWQHGVKEEFGPGALIALPEGEEVDLVNVPKDAQNPFISLSLRIGNEDVPSCGLAPITTNPLSRFRVSQARHITSAILDAFEDLGARPSNVKLLEFRRKELLRILATDPIARCLFDRSIKQLLGRMIYGEPDRDWTVDIAAAEMGLGASTLRRKLHIDGTRFTHVLREQRLCVAQRVLSDGATVFEAQTASGFRSRSHFAKHFWNRFGASPSRMRAADVSSSKLEVT